MTVQIKPSEPGWTFKSTHTSSQGFGVLLLTGKCPNFNLGDLFICHCLQQFTYSFTYFVKPGQFMRCLIIFSCVLLPDVGELRDTTLRFDYVMILT